MRALRSIFQSHYGLILSFNIPSFRRPCRSFQSHYGLILSPVNHRYLPVTQNAFNPTMVWFYLGRTVQNAEDGWFAFNPTMVWFYLPTQSRQEARRSAFNPTMVWFYLKTCFRVEIFNTSLSIPLWSDFILSSIKDSITKSLKENFQSHYGLILS